MSESDNGPDSDRNTRGRDVQERLAQRFSSPDKEDSDPSDPYDPSDPSDQTETRDSAGIETADQPNGSKPGGNGESPYRLGGDVSNVKEEWDGNYIYTWGALSDHLTDEFNRLQYECGREINWKPRKVRHFYPVIVIDGLATVEDMGPVEFYERVKELEIE